MIKRIYFFVGTTTELIKLAPVIRELEKRQKDFKIITSGQTEVNFSELSFFIKKSSADLAFGEKVHKSSLYFFVIWFIKALLQIPTLRQEFKGLNKHNSYFIVHGDPVSSLVGAVIAKFYNLKLVHIESGLRSFNFLEPFPEELCRLIISKLADVHFCPNEWSLNNLSKIGGVKINTVQNTQIESCLAALKNKAFDRNVLKFKEKNYFVLIIHRQEHVIFRKAESKRLIKFILNQADKNILCIFIRHATTYNFLKSVNFKLTSEQKKRVKFVSRLHYIDFVNLMNNSQFLITDGGGNQEEAYYMGLPCLLIRNNTERIEGLGENAVLYNGNKHTIRSFMRSYKKYRRGKVKFRIRPSEIVVDYLR